MATRHPHLLSRTRAAVFVVDIQEAFRSHIAGFSELVAATSVLARGAAALDVPIAYSEQYPRGLGATVDELSSGPDAPLANAPWFEKLEISSFVAPGWHAELPPAVRDAEQLIIVGIEAHVCVSQTVHDALAAGRQVHVVQDAVGSRSTCQRDAALSRMANAGAILTTVEMALFELLERAGTEEFKAVQRLIKEYDAARAASGRAKGAVHA